MFDRVFWITFFVVILPAMLAMAVLLVAFSMSINWLVIACLVVLIVYQCSLPLWVHSVVRKVQGW